MKLFTNRQYKTGTQWGIWLWTFVPSNYITRLHLIKTPLFSVCLHWLNKPDEEPYLHDHPVSFVSFILRGWYKEERVQFVVQAEPAGFYHYIKLNKWINFIEGSRRDRHRIIEVAPNTLTLCFMGPKIRGWGFYLEDGRWMHWKNYYKCKKVIEDFSKEWNKK